MSAEDDDTVEDSPEMELAPEKDFVSDELTAEEAAADPAAPARRRLPEAVWAEIQEKYESGKFSVADLLDEYKITHSALTRRWDKIEKMTGVRPRKGSKAHLHAAAVSSAITAGTAAAAATTAAAVESFESKRKAKIERAKTSLDLQTDMLQRATIDIQKKIVAGTPASEFDSDLKALGRLASVLEKTKGLRWGVLEIDVQINEDQLPILEVRDMSDADILEAQRRAAEGDGEDEDDDEDFPEIPIGEDEEA